MNAESADILQCLIMKLESQREHFYSMSEDSKKYRLHETFNEIPGKQQLKSNMKPLYDYLVDKEKSDIDRILFTLNSVVTSTYPKLATDDFDQKYGVSTSQEFEQYEMNEPASLERLLHCSRYVPSPSASVTQILEFLPSLDLQPKEFTFIDVGSGSGRVIFIASDYPFKKTIGVEISQHLHELALSNLQQYQNLKRPKCDIEFVCADIFEMDLPKGNVIFYLWGPFGEQNGLRFAKTIEKLTELNQATYILILLGRMEDPATHSTKFRLIGSITTEDHFSKEKLKAFIYESLPNSKQEDRYPSKG